MENGYIADEFVTASSALRVNNEPWLARLHNQLGEGAWCAGVRENIFSVVTLEKITVALATQ